MTRLPILSIITWSPFLAALVIMAGLALIVVLVLLLALAIEARRHRRLAVRRAALDRQFYRTAALSITRRGGGSRCCAA